MLSDTKLIRKEFPEKYFFVIFEGFCALQTPRKERRFQGITREIRNCAKVLISNFFRKYCNLCGHLQRCQMPDSENSRKNSRKGCRVGRCKTAEKQPEEQPKQPKNSRFDCFSAVLPAVFRLFFGCFTVTHSAPFSVMGNHELTPFQYGA